MGVVDGGVTGLGDGVRPGLVLGVVLGLVAGAFGMWLVTVRGQRRLRQQGERLQGIVEGLPDAVLIGGTEGQIEAANGAAGRLFGAARVQRGAALSAIVPESPEVGANREIRLRNGDGETFPALVETAPWRDGTGRSGGTIWTVRDMTEPHRFVLQFQASQQELAEVRAALDQHAIVAITDPRGRITYVNDKFCAISQYSSDELVGQDHRIINSGHHPATFFAELWRTIGRGEVWHGEVKNRAKDGSFYWMDTTIVPFVDERGKPRQFVAIRSDITPLKEAEEGLRHRAEELKRSNRDLEQFAYVASHDLQEPLRAVAGCLQVLQRRLEGKLDSRGEELIGHAVDGASRMQSLIEGLLAFSRVGTRGRALVTVSCDAALDDALKNLVLAMRESNAEVTRDPLPEVTGDAQQLAQLFQNLIGNALKFRGREVPRVHVGLQEQPGVWVITIADNGIGIEPQYFERIFAIFQRLHTRREYPGTGIGLALCKKIVERHGGWIEVESEPGVGTTFRCCFPRVGRRPSATVAQTEPASALS